MLTVSIQCSKHTKCQSSSFLCDVFTAKKSLAKANRMAKFRTHTSMTLKESLSPADQNQVYTVYLQVICLGPKRERTFGRKPKAFLCCRMINEGDMQEKDPPPILSSPVKNAAITNGTRFGLILEQCDLFCCWTGTLTL